MLHGGEYIPKGQIELELVCAHPLHVKVPKGLMSLVHQMMCHFRELVVSPGCPSLVQNRIARTVTLTRHTNTLTTLITLTLLYEPAGNGYHINRGSSLDTYYVVGLVLAICNIERLVIRHLPRYSEIIG